MPKSTLFDRSQVMDQVTKLFWKKGFHATSMQDLVDTTGLNRSSIYNTFGDKCQLFEEALKYYQTMQFEMTSQSLSKHASPLESIKSLFYTILQNIDLDKEKRGCLLANCTTELANSDAKIREFLISNKDQMIEVLQKHLQEAKDLGEVNSSTDVHVSALFLYTSLHGLQITSMLYTDKNMLKSVVEKVLEKI